MLSTTQPKVFYYLDYITRHIGPTELDISLKSMYALKLFTPQPLRAVGVLFSPMVSRWAGGQAGGGKKFVRAVSQKLLGVGS